MSVGQSLELGLNEYHGRSCNNAGVIFSPACAAW